MLNRKFKPSQIFNIWLHKIIRNWYRCIVVQTNVMLSCADDEKSDTLEPLAYWHDIVVDQQSLITTTTTRHTHNDRKYCEQTGTWPGGRCDMWWSSPIITDYHKTMHFRWRNVFDNICRMGRWSFWSWIDINRSIFDEDMSRKLFSVDLDCWPLDLKFAPLVIFARRYVSTR